eukprot:TRINITY_DN3500_c0_g1_i1.p1 TRINITY_DN3500_c0_g1~~TRINITY_DN3500_c0_g1_i1.p1  ORF type:complete len:213 (+),score=49.40 TRINITY_DN3500_c0_g1_i1:80-640(+)
MADRAPDSVVRAFAACGDNGWESFVEHLAASGKSPQSLVGAPASEVDSAVAAWAKSTARFIPPFVRNSAAGALRAWATAAQATPAAAVASDAASRDSPARPPAAAAAPPPPAEDTSRGAKAPQQATAQLPASPALASASATGPPPGAGGGAAPPGADLQHGQGWCSGSKYHDALLAAAAASIAAGA